MSTKHTPGPWGLEITATSTWVGPLKASGAKVADVVVHVEGGRGTGYREEFAEKQLANARLIAAAPDLLEALKWVMSAHGEQLHDAFDAAHKAIAKAEGAEQQ